MTEPSEKTRISSNSSRGSGNTKTLPLQISPAKHWCFTYNNFDSSKILLFSEIENHVKRYIYQEERGQEGTPHLQGYVEFNEKVRPKSFMELPKQIHWEKTRKIANSIEYCRKSETRVGDIFMKGFRQPVNDPIKSYRTWQKHLSDDLRSNSDDRKIRWIVDIEGGSGKTAFAKHWYLNNKNTTLYLTGKSSDMKCAISKFLENEENDLKYVFMDFTRSVENYVSYQSIEEIKNGIFFSGKYESSMCVFNSPHVIIFSNFVPDTTQLSKDRWILQKLTKE